MPPRALSSFDGCTLARHLQLARLSGSYDGAMRHVCVTMAAHLRPPVCCLQDKCHPQTIAVCQSRADGLGLKVLVSSEEDFKFDKDVSGILMQYPATDGAVHDYKVSHCSCRWLFAGGAHHHVACFQQRSVYKSPQSI